MKSKTFNLGRRKLLSTACRFAPLLATPALLTQVGCSTLDEYLIEDEFDFTQEVLIVGGGLSGLYAAYELKKLKIPFRLFESSSRLGGKIQSIQSDEWGAYEFSKNDKVLLKLKKELDLETVNIDQNSWRFKNGASALTEQIFDVIEGLIPEKQVRRGYNLKSVSRIGRKYQLRFDVQGKSKVFFARNVILALPKNRFLNLESIDNVSELKNMVTYLKTVNDRVTLRMILPLAEFRQKKTDLSDVLSSELMSKSSLGATVSGHFFNKKYYMTVSIKSDDPLRQVDTLQKALKPYMNESFVLDEQTLKDWGNLSSGGGMDSQSVLNKIPQNQISVLWPSQKLQVVNESLIHAQTGAISTVEGLLRLVDDRLQIYKI